MIDQSVTYWHSFFWTADETAYTPFGSLVDFSCNVLWLICLGALGSCGYLGTTLISESRRLANASAPASGQQGAQGVKATSPPTTSLAVELDLTDAHLVATRVVLGMLFSFLIGAPLYTGSLTSVEGALSNRSGSPPADVKQIFTSLGLTLLPFVLGFSTTLVLGIMERFVSAVATLFGIQTR
jgi:hypothetical protein